MNVTNLFAIYFLHDKISLVGTLPKQARNFYNKNFVLILLMDVYHDDLL